MHGDAPVGLDERLPYLRQNYLAVGTYKIIVALVNLWTDDVYMQKSLLNEFLHALVRC